MSDQSLVVEAPAITVASWRHLSPERLGSVRHDLRAFLLSITSLPDLPGILTKGSADEPAAAMAVACAVRDMIEDDESDLVWSWIALSGVSGRYGMDDVSELAHLAVAARLVALSAEAIVSDRALGLRLRMLALRWADPVAESLGTGRIVEQIFGASRAAYASVQAIIEGFKPPKPEAEKPARTAGDALRAKLGLNAAEPKPPAHTGKPSLTVVREIAPGRGGSEDRGIVAAWEPLTKPMHLAAGVAPRVLREALLAEFPWMSEAVDALVGDLELRRQAGSAHAHFRPLALVGPPGSGKTRFARRVAGLLGTGFGEVNAGGSSDNRLVAGTARGWSSASPAFVLHVMRSSSCANPLIFIDEIDKAASGGSNGDVRATMLTMIGNAAWPDECLMATADLSQVMWVFAANGVLPLRGPLLTRLRVVGVPNPGPEHADAVIASIGRDVALELGLPPGFLPDLPPEAEAALRDAFTKGFSVRRVRAAYEGALRAGGMVGKSRTVN
jgi:hypothetical protein